MLTFRAKLLASYVALVIAVVAVAVVQLDRSLSRDLRQKLDQRLEQQALGASQWGGGEGRRHPEKVATRLSKVLGVDVTMFDEKGQAVGDSRPEPVGAGDVGPELDTALKGGVGRASRRSALSSVETYYVAVQASDGWVIRLSVPLSDIEATVTSMRSQLIFAAMLALVAALGLGLFASRALAGPLREMTASAKRIADGDFDIALGPGAPDEFGMLSESLTSLARQLKARIGELVAERDRLRKVVLANPAAATILGAGAPLETASLADVVTDEGVRRFVEAGLSSGQTAETEIVSAGERSTAVYVTPLEARAGGGIVCVLRDMTPIRRLLTMRRDFMANASHELRTPVAAIQGYSETLLRGGVPPAEQRQFLETIHRHARRLAGLVDDVLRLSEIEDRPEGATRTEPVNVRGVASLVLDTVGARAEQAKVALELAIPDALTALADEASLEQVLENLVDNAVKYGKSGGRVMVEGRAREGRVVIEVKDDGAGIEAKHLPRLFERFYRVDPSRSRERGGNGLGLAIVKQLIESMGGSVAVDSTVGAGTAFRVELPAASLPISRPPC
jgi:two-component system, OmpR family, phosphate regulon sensor histidine kinase PhoR